MIVSTRTSPQAGDTSRFSHGALTYALEGQAVRAADAVGDGALHLQQGVLPSRRNGSGDPPTSWAELYAFADKLHVENRYGGLAALTAPFLALLYYEIFLNSTPTKLLSPDRTQIEFDNEDGLSALKAMEDGWKSEFFDPSGLAGAADYDSALLFNQGLTASQINFAELWAQAVSGDVDNFKATIKPEVVGVTIMPGVTPNTSGSFNGYDGLGVSKFSRNKEAAMSLIKECTGVENQRAMNLTKVLPSSRAPC